MELSKNIKKILKKNNIKIDPFILDVSDISGEELDKYPMDMPVKHPILGYCTVGDVILAVNNRAIIWNKGGWCLRSEKFTDFKLTKLGKESQRITEASQNLIKCLMRK